MSSNLVLANAEQHKDENIEENQEHPEGVDEETDDPQHNKIHHYHHDIELTDEQKQLLEQKKAELKEKYLANIDQMDEEQKKTALKKYKEELFTFMEKELGLTFKRKHKDDSPQS